jgi:hypothetical protein
VSVTVTVKEAAPVLPCASVAEQPTVVAASGKVAPLAGVQVTATVPSTASLAVAVYAKVAPVAAVASTVAFDGTVITGASESRTVTVNEVVPLLACASVAVHPTVVVPNGKIAPLAGVQLTATLPSTASVLVALNVKLAPVAAVASTVAFGGTVITGPLVSVTVTVKEAAPVLPCASVAVQRTVVAASGNIAPLAGAQVTATVPSTASLAVAV